MLSHVEVRTLWLDAVRSFGSLPRVRCCCWWRLHAPTGRKRAHRSVITLAVLRRNAVGILQRLDVTMQQQTEQQSTRFIVMQAER